MTISALENARLHEITSTINEVLAEDETNCPTYVSGIHVSTNPTSLSLTYYIVILEHTKAALLTIGELDNIRTKLSEIGIFIDGIYSRSKRSLELFLLENTDSSKRQAEVDKELEDAEQR